MSLARKLDLIRSVSLFSQIEPAPLRQLAEVAAELSVPAGTRLLAAGEPADGACIVEAGEVHLTGPGCGVDGLMVGPGTLIGARALIIPARNVFDADCPGPVRLITLTRAAVMDVLTAHPDAARPLRRHFAREMQTFTETLERVRRIMSAPDDRSRS